MAQETAIDRERIAYRPAEAADVFGISRAMLYELIARGDIPARKLGARTLILRTDLERYAAALPTYEPQDAA